MALCIPPSFSVDFDDHSDHKACKAHCHGSTDDLLWINCRGWTCAHDHLDCLRVSGLPCQRSHTDRACAGQRGLRHSLEVERFRLWYPCTKCANVSLDPLYGHKVIAGEL
jgi:hypothetical protein